MKCSHKVTCILSLLFGSTLISPAQTEEELQPPITTGPATTALTIIKVVHTVIKIARSGIQAADDVDEIQKLHGSVSGNSILYGDIYGSTSLAITYPSFVDENGVTQKYDYKSNFKLSEDNDMAVGVLVRDFTQSGANNNPRVEYCIFELGATQASAAGIYHQSRGSDGSQRMFYGVHDSRFYATASEGVAYGYYGEIDADDTPDHTKLQSDGGGEGIFYNNYFEVHGSRNAEAVGIKAPYINADIINNEFKVGSSNNNAYGMLFDHDTWIIWDPEKGLSNDGIDVLYSSKSYVKSIGNNTIDVSSSGSGYSAVGMFLKGEIGEFLSGNVIKASNHSPTVGSSAIGIQLFSRSVESYNLFKVEDGYQSLFYQDLVSTTTIGNGGITAISGTTINAYSAGDFAIGLAVNGVILDGDSLGGNYILKDLNISASSSMGRAVGIGLESERAFTIENSNFTIIANGNVYGYVYGKDIGTDVSAGGIALYNAHELGDTSSNYILGNSNNFTIQSLGNSSGVDASLQPATGNGAYGFYVSSGDGEAVIYDRMLNANLYVIANGSSFGVFLGENSTLAGIESEQSAPLDISSTSSSAASYGIYLADNATLDGLADHFNSNITSISTNEVAGGRAYGIYLNTGASIKDNFQGGSIEVRSNEGANIAIYQTTANQMSAISDSSIESYSNNDNAYAFLWKGILNQETDSVLFYNAESHDSSGFTVNNNQLYVNNSGNAYGIHSSINITEDIAANTIHTRSTEGTAYALYLASPATSINLSGTYLAQGYRSVGITNESKAHVHFTNAFGGITAMLDDGNYGNVIQTSADLSLSSDKQGGSELLGNIAMADASLHLMSGLYNLSAHQMEMQSLKLGTDEHSATLNLMQSATLVTPSILFYANSADDYSQINIAESQTLTIDSETNIQLILSSTFNEDTNAHYLSLISGTIEGANYFNLTVTGATASYHEVITSKGYGVVFAKSDGLIIRDEANYGDVNQDVSVSHTVTPARSIQIYNSNVANINSNVYAFAQDAPAYALWVDGIGEGYNTIGSIGGSFTIQGANGDSYGILLGKEAATNDSVALYNTQTKNSEQLPIDWANIKIAVIGEGPNPYKQYAAYLLGKTMTDTHIGGELSISSSNTGGGASLYMENSQIGNISTTAKIVAYGFENESNISAINLINSSIDTIEQDAQLFVNAAGRAVGIEMSQASHIEQFSGKLNVLSSNSTAYGIHMSSESSIGLIENAQIIAQSQSSYGIFIAENGVQNNLTLSGDTIIQASTAIQGAGDKLFLQASSEGLSNIQIDGAITGFTTIDIAETTHAQFSNYDSLSFEVSINNKGHLTLQAASTSQPLDAVHITNEGTLSLSADYLQNITANSGTIQLTGGSILDSYAALEGTQKVEIAENAQVHTALAEQIIYNINNKGNLSIDSGVLNRQIYGTGMIELQANKELTSSANNLQQEVNLQSNSTLILTGGEISHKIHNNSGKVQIAQNAIVDIDTALFNNNNFDVQGTLNLSQGQGSVESLSVSGTINVFANASITLPDTMPQDSTAAMSLTGSLNISDNASLFISAAEGGTADVDLANGTINLGVYASIHFLDGVDATFLLSPSINVDLYGIQGEFSYDLMSYSTADPLSELSAMTLSHFEELITVYLSGGAEAALEFNYHLALIDDQFAANERRLVISGAVIPEPSSAMLSLIALSALCLRRRRRHGLN